MKILFLPIFLIVAAMLPVAAQLENTSLPVEAGAPPINIYGRQQIDLNGKWKYIIDPFKRPLKRSSRRWNFQTNEIQSEDGQLIEYEWSTSPEINVPGDWNYQIEELKWYNGLIWYSREIDFAAQTGKRVFLNFEAANYRTHVYLNGVKIGEHEGGFTPFAFEVTGKLKAKNFLVVGVDAEHTKRQDPTRLVSAALDTGGVRGDTTVLDDPWGQYLDIIAINTYFGWYGDGLPDVIVKKKWETSYNKPMVFSEFGADAPKGNLGDKNTRWTEEYQRYMYEETLKSAARYPFIRGTMPWILKDFRSPRRWHFRHQNYWNRKGLISPTGERKLAFKTLADWYKQLAGSER